MKQWASKPLVYDEYETIQLTSVNSKKIIFSDRFVAEKSWYRTSPNILSKSLEINSFVKIVYPDVKLHLRLMVWRWCLMAWSSYGWTCHSRGQRKDVLANLRERVTTGFINLRPGGFHAEARLSNLRLFFSHFWPSTCYVHSFHEIILSVFKLGDTPTRRAWQLCLGLRPRSSAPGLRLMSVCGWLSHIYQYEFQIANCFLSES